MCWNGGIKPSILEGLQLQGSASLAVIFVAHELLRDMLSSGGGECCSHPKAARVHICGHDSRRGPGLGIVALQLRSFTTKVFWFCFLISSALAMQCSSQAEGANVNKVLRSEVPLRYLGRG